MALLGFKVFDETEDPFRDWGNGWSFTNDASPGDLSKYYMEGRLGRTAFYSQTTSTNTNHRVHWSAPSGTGLEGVIGFAYNVERAGINNNSRRLMIARAFNTASNELTAWELNLDPTTLQFYFEHDATRSEVAIVADSWTFVEVGYRISNTNGYLRVRVNGVQILELLGDTYRGTGTPDTLASFGFYAAYSSNYLHHRLQDIYICDNTGPAPYNTFLGDVTAERLYPDDNGTVSELVGSDGNSIDNYLNVQDNSMLTYNESDTPGDRDLYKMSGVSEGAASVLGVQIQAQGTVDTEGISAVRTVTSDGVNETLDPVVGLGIGKTYLLTNIQTAAPDGTPWTVAKVEAAEYGVEIVDE